MSKLVHLFDFRSIAVVQSDTTTYNPPIRGIIISEDDVTVAIKNDNGDTVTLTIPAVADGASLPYTWWCGNASQILASGTTAANGNMVALQG